jgi:3-oxoacyl-[acyl-carrier protein] reductase
MRNVIVTGGSRGIGLGIACKLASAGYRVIAIARHSSAPLAAAIREASAAGAAGALEFRAFDLSDTAGIAPLVREIRRDAGPIFGLVNNAGLGTSGVLAMMPDADIERLLRVNTISPIVLTKYVVRSMMVSGAGRIVNISSVVGFAGYSGLAAYSASKSALMGFTRSLAREVGRLGINVNAVAPGFVATSMTEAMSEEVAEQIVRRSALRRTIGIEDVANAVEFLLSDRAQSITGTVLTVDAGNTA